MPLTHDGRVRYTLKPPYTDGTTHVIFEPLDFMARLAALVAKPRVNLTRFHGVFAPNSKDRVTIYNNRELSRHLGKRHENTAPSLEAAR